MIYVMSLFIVLFQDDVYWLYCLLLQTKLLRDNKDSLI